ncbi:hypothetical protein PV392_29715, partial [Streptomyces sp. ME03-5709C]|nr:hypothetical protein [Streptomyces sp. ME03-5709C]
MSEHNGPSTSADSGASERSGRWDRTLAALIEALSNPSDIASVAAGLRAHPILLTGLCFGIILVPAAAALHNGTLLLVGGLLLGMFLLSLIAHLVSRRLENRSPAGAGERRRVEVRRSRRIRVSHLGTWRGDSRVRVNRSDDVVIDDVPRGYPAPAIRSASEDTGTVTPRRTTARQPYTPTLARARDAVLTAARVGSPTRGAHFEVLADSGCGKTLLLEEVAAGLKDDGRLVLFVTASAPQYGESRIAGETERHMADYAACRQIVDAIAADVHRAYTPESGENPVLDPTEGRELETAILGVRDVRRLGSSLPAHVTVEVSRSHDVHLTDIGSALLAPISTQSLTEMQRQLTELLDEVARKQPTALLVDDVHVVARTPVESWLMAVMRGMSTAVVVHGGRPATDDTPTPGIRRIALGRLPHEETINFVRERLVEAGWSPAAATAAATDVAVLTRGHPIGMATCSTIICDSLSVNASTEEIRSLILGGAEHWDDGGAFDAVRTYVDGRAARVTGRSFPLFDLLVVLRRCTDGILAAVLDDMEAIPAGQALQLYDWLSRCAFVTPFDDDANEGWRLHDYLRENHERRFRHTRPTEHAALHARAERYYRARMNFDEQREEQPVMALGARYEDPDWQRDSHEWLHHVAHLPRDEFEGSKRAMIRLFLEAFYWWDMEVPSTYCDQLLAAYRALPDDRDLRWVAWLDQLRTGYVPGRVNQAPGRDRERWEQAREALDEIAQYLRLRRGHVPTDPDLRRIYIIHCQLVGEATWFGSEGTGADRNRAAAWFQASRIACTEENELWMGNWAAVDEAALWATTQPARARTLLEGLEARIASEEDNELPILLAETFADIAWAEDDPGRCFDAHARAALHGFVYHVRQETYGQYPSRYTDSLYRGVLSNLERRERRAVDAGLIEELTAAKARSRALFAPYWRLIGQDPVDTFGVPHPPAASDLGTDTAAVVPSSVLVSVSLGAAEGMRTATVIMNVC